MAEITYSLDFPHHELPPTQEEFERLMGTMSCFDVSFSELLEYCGEWSLAEACAAKKPLPWWLIGKEMDALLARGEVPETLKEISALRALSNNVARLVLAGEAIADELHMLRRGQEGNPGCFEDPIGIVYGIKDLGDFAPTPDIV